MLSALTDEIPQDGFEAMEKLNSLTGVPVPKNLAGLKGRAVRFGGCIDREAMSEYVQKAVKE